MGELREEARSVPGLLLRAPGAPVIQVQEDLDPLAHDLVGLDVLQVGDEADAAGVVLEARIVEVVARLHFVHPAVVPRPPGLGVNEAPDLPAGEASLSVRRR